MTLEQAIELGRRSSIGQKSINDVYVTSDGCVYRGSDVEALKAHAQSNKLTLYDISEGKVICNPRKKIKNEFKKN